LKNCGLTDISSLKSRVAESRTFNKYAVCRTVRSLQSPPPQPERWGGDTEHAPPFSYNLAFAIQLKIITEKLRIAEKCWAGAQSLSGYDL
jgi:hypothetical protein